MLKTGKRREMHPQRVLIVDDEPFATHMLGRLLRKHGYIAAELNDATKAVSMAHRFQPDIFLLDLHMPWKDGYELAADFEADESLRRVPIVFMTADLFQQAPPASSHRILFKPFSIEDLLGHLKEGIARNLEEA